MFRPRRARRPGLGILLLAAQIFQVGANRIPPVTLSVIGLNVGIYLRLLKGLPSLAKACVSAHHVWYDHDWMRLVFSPFFHLDDWHLYYNMVSFLWKGKSLEPTMGSPRFLYVLAVFSVLTNVLLVGLDIVLAKFLEDPSYIYTCAAGFSGVIFALKVVTTYNLPSGVSRILGIFPVPVRWAYWAELIVIQLLVPNVSFTGHLAGILVGLMYVKGPLKALMDGIAGIGGVPGGRPGSGPSYGQPSYTYHAAATGTTHNSRPQPRRKNDSDDEELQAAIRASLRETHRYPNPASYYHDNDPNVQSVIEESIAGASGRAQGRGSQTQGHYTEGHQQAPPPYPPGEVPYPTTEDSDPPVGSQTGRPQPRGPLIDEHTGAPLPYPQASAPPEGQFGGDTLPYPRHDRMPTVSLDEVRQRRLRRFES